MGRVEKKKLLCALAGILGSAITLTAITPGVASAQSGSRLCGRSWKSVKTGEIITRIYEVPKGEWYKQCNRASRDGMLVQTSPFANRLIDQNFANWQSFKVDVSETVWSERAGWHQRFTAVDSDFHWETCEGWKDRSAELGGLDGRDLNFIGDNWPKQHNQADICKNMNRSDSLFEMERYWLYDDNDPATNAVDFQRG
jgi:hypothetical protein